MIWIALKIFVSMVAILLSAGIVLWIKDDAAPDPYFASPPNFPRTGDKGSLFRTVEMFRGLAYFCGYALALACVIGTVLLWV